MKHSDQIELLFKDCLVENRQAQERLYALTAANMLGVCQRYGASPHEAEDILQNGYVKVFKNIQQFREEGSFEGWIRSIMINTAIEHYRKKKRRIQTIDLEDLTFEDTPAAPDWEAMDYDELLALIQQLPDGYRMVFNLYVIEGYSHKEIAKLLDIREGTSKSQLQRARRWLMTKIHLLEGEQYGKATPQAGGFKGTRI